MFFDSSTITLKDYCGFVTSCEHYEEKRKESQNNWEILEFR